FGVQLRERFVVGLARGMLKDASDVGLALDRHVRSRDCPPRRAARPPASGGRSDGRSAADGCRASWAGSVSSRRCRQTSTTTAARRRTASGSLPFASQCQDQTDNILKLGIVLPYSGADMSFPIDRVLEAERLGFDSVWTSEAYGSDAVTPAAWVLARTTRIKVGTAIMQMPARTPAMTAMTAMTLDALSGGRFVLGIGPSGPQVVEGWHGVAYGKPLLRTREYIEIIRKILERNEPLTYAGEHYQIPFAGPGATGLGK